MQRCFRGVQPPGGFAKRPRGAAVKPVAHSNLGMMLPNDRNVRSQPLSTSGSISAKYAVGVTAVAITHRNSGGR